MDYFAFVTIICVLCCVSQVSTEVPQYYVDEHCSQTLALDYGSVEAVRLRLTKTGKYPDGMMCAMRIQAPEGKRLVIRIEEVDIAGTQGTLCQNGDYLQIFDGPSESSIVHPELPATVCEKPAVSFISTSGRFLVLRFLSNTDGLTGSGVRLVLTAFSDAPCTENQFQCSSTGHCIQRSLHCDGKRSCPDGSDERLPDCLSTGAIAGIAVASVVVLVAIVAAIVIACIVHERRKRARIIKRAMVHQLQHQTYANSLWIDTQLPGLQSSNQDCAWDAHIDPSKVDPIWDGGDSDRSDEKSRGSVNEYNSCKDDSKVVESDEGEKRVKITGPQGLGMKKVPSGFWEIDLSELGIYVKRDSFQDTPAM